MPVESSVPISAVDQDGFHAVDKVLVGHAFDIHNEFGRLLDESVYKTELARRCARAGLEVNREVLLRVQHGSFAKDYRIDLLLNRGVVVEVKTVAGLTPAHRGQALNYLLLAGVHHGSLINFRGGSLQREFVSSRQGVEERRRFIMSFENWPKDELRPVLVQVVEQFCRDLGLGLDVPLYRDGVCHLLGDLRVRQEDVPVVSEGGVIGTHPMHILADGSGLAITSLMQTDDFRRHLQRLMKHTNLRGVSWVNMSNHQITFEHV